MNSERISTNTIVKQRRLLKKDIYEINKTIYGVEEELNKDMENLRKKYQTEILEIKSPFSQIKNSRSPLHQIRTSGIQNLGTQR
jgi:propanediol dehydratase small subunit